MNRVLVTPMDWGLGHATRCIPVIRELTRRQCEVVIAGTGDSLKLLQAEFPASQHIRVPGYRPVYPRNGGMSTKMIIQVPKFLKTIRDEHKVIGKIVKDRKIDLIISDNRYGAWSPDVKSVLITHQSNIMMPERFGWLQPIVRNLNYRFINRFSQCWIPDNSRGLAGDLAAFDGKKIKIPVNFIGPLSRFSPKGNTKKFDIAAIFSGPEPQRTMLEETVMPFLARSGLKYFVVRGVPGSKSETGNPNVVNFLASGDLQKIIESSEIILARSGYSTVMDLSALGKRAIFIPTPGQTEQEYLAASLMKKEIAFSMPQNKFDLRIALREASAYAGFRNVNVAAGDEGGLAKALDALI